jgi:hypothetical protein
VLVPYGFLRPILKMPRAGDRRRIRSVSDGSYDRHSHQGANSRANPAAERTCDRSYCASSDGILTTRIGKAIQGLEAASSRAPGGRSLHGRAADAGTWHRRRHAWKAQAADARGVAAAQRLKKKPRSAGFNTS